MFAIMHAQHLDLGNRFRRLANEVDVIAPERPMPKPPVAYAWRS